MNNWITHQKYKYPYPRLIQPRQMKLYSPMKLTLMKVKTRSENNSQVFDQSGSTQFR